MITTSMPTANEDRGSVDLIKVAGTPNLKQQKFFQSRARFTAYGGARGGGKSWALRRKLVAMCLRYEGLRCLLVRRTLPELKSNHVIPFLKEYKGILTYSESEKSLKFSNGSCIYMGFCASDKDALRYQGQASSAKRSTRRVDVIAHVKPGGTARVRLLSRQSNCFGG